MRILRLIGSKTYWYHIERVNDCPWKHTIASHFKSSRVDSSQHKLGGRKDWGIRDWGIEKKNKVCLGNAEALELLAF